MLRYGILLLVIPLLTGCQSSRPAFYFGARPGPSHPAPTIAADSAVPQRRPATVAAATTTPHPAAGHGRPESAFGPRALLKAARRESAAATLSRPARRGSTAAQALRLPVRSRAAATSTPLRRSGLRQHPAYVDSSIVIVLLVFAGLTSLILLLVSLFTLSGTLALIGLGLLLLVLLTLNTLWDNHWSFG